jgi:hypothetical protein
VVSRLAGDRCPAKCLAGSSFGRPRCWCDGNSRRDSWGAGLRPFGRMWGKRLATLSTRSRFDAPEQRSANHLFGCVANAVSALASLGGFCRGCTDPFANLAVRRFRAGAVGTP